MSRALAWIARKSIQILISLIRLSLSSQTEEGTLTFENIDLTINQAEIRACHRQNNLSNESFDNVFIRYLIKQDSNP